MTSQQEILSLEKQFWQTMIDRDTEASVALVSDPCVVTGAQGVASIDRKHFAKLMETGSWKLHSYAFSDVTFQGFGDDLAVIAYKVHEELTVDGEKLALDAVDASTWVRRDGKWLCALHTESILGDPYGRDRRKDTPEKAV